MADMHAQRPPRPLGVALAIFTSLFLFTLLPLMQIGMILVVQRHFSSLEFPEGGPQPIVVGGDFLGVSPWAILAQALIAVIFAIILVFAWRGRPSFIRFVFVGSVIFLTLMKIAAMLIQSSATQNLSEGISSLDSLVATFGSIQVVVELVVMIYVVWYLNRGPARAFYRGYYLSRRVPDENPRG